jgi:O-antigen ligase
VLGLGFSNYWHYASLYPIMGYAVEFNSHDQYLDIVLQTGFVGGATFLWLMEALAWLGLRLRGRLTDGFAQGYVDACLAGLAGSLAAGFLGDWFLPFVYNIGIGGFRSSMLGWFFLGGLVAIEQMTRRAGGESPRAER